MTSTACRAPEIHALRVGYTLPSLQAILYHVDGTVIDLTDVTNVQLLARRQAKDVAVKIDRAAIIVDAEAGEVRFNFLPGDVDVVARYDAYFVLTYTDSRELPVPNPGFFSIVVGHA